MPRTGWTAPVFMGFLGRTGGQTGLTLARTGQTAQAGRVGPMGVSRTRKEFVHAPEGKPTRQEISGTHNQNDPEISQQQGYHPAA